MRVYVDDIRVPERGEWDAIVRNFDAALALLKTGKVTYISLDHDLGQDSLTGYDLAKWIETEVFIDPGFKCPDIVVHSANPVGRNNIIQCMGSINKELYRRSQN